MIAIRLDSEVPLEEQIYQEVRRAIARGLPGEGEELPSARQLGADLGVHWNTVARAYRRLHTDGLVTAGQGRRVRVRKQDPSRQQTTQSRQRVAQKLEEALTEALLGGVSPAEALEILRRQLRAAKEKV